MKSKTESINWKHGPVGDSIKDFFGGSYNLHGNSKGVEYESFFKNVLNDYLKSVEKDRR